MTLSEVTKAKVGHTDFNKLDVDTQKTILMDYMEQFPEYAKNLQEVFDCDNQTFTTSGVYLSGTHVVNGVDASNIIQHIYYNIVNRPGRAFFCNGLCLNQGYLSDESILTWTYFLKNIKSTKDTRPYL